jgi:hypothetical protein
MPAIPFPFPAVLCAKNQTDFHHEGHEAHEDFNHSLFFFVFFVVEISSQSQALAADPYMSKNGRRSALTLLRYHACVGLQMDIFQGRRRGKPGGAPRALEYS